MKIAPRDVAGLIKAPGTQYSAFLLYGPDQGLVRERARQLAHHFCDQPDDPFAQASLTGQQVSEDKARLADEANAVNIFGGLRLVTLSGSGTEMTEAVKLAFTSPNPDARIIVRASDVNTRHALVKLCEEAKFCAAIGCYSDDARNLSEIARDIFARDNIRVSAEVMGAITARLGADRQMSLSELNKLALYAGDGGSLTLKDVAIALGDSGAVAIDEVSLALLTGQIEAFERDYARLRHEGIQPIAVIRQLLTLFKNMQMAKAQMQAGLPASQAIVQLRPPVHFKMKPVITRQLGLWRPEQISQSIDRLMQAEIQTKSAGSVDPATLTGQILLGICLRARHLNARH
jgi:DNA polymerase-3 subunit delta